MSRRALSTGLLTGALSLALTAALAPFATAAPTVTGASAVPATAVAAASQPASLTYSPKAFVGGQAMTFSGRLPVTGRRAISLQQHMGRPGDVWFAVRGYSGYSAADGSFRVEVPAPDMWNIRYRVVAAGAASPSVLLSSKSQGATLWVAGSDRANASRPGTAQAGRPFTVTADTTPTIPGRPYVTGTPTFVGRTLTLQRRLSATRWENLGTTTVQPDGNGYFTGITAPAGTSVLRVRQEAITSGANRVGWMGSYPTHVRVASTDGRLPAADLTAASAGPSPEAGLPALGAQTTASGGGGTANGANRWGAMLFDYAFEHGESISDPPRSSSSGGWAEHTTGSGRVSKHNGQLTLDSKESARPGAGDFGTTTATELGNPRAYGRWQARLRMKSSETAARDYTVRLELVPAAAADYDCGAHNITIGEVRAHSRSLRIGVKAGSRQWAGTRTIPSLLTSPPALGVEVQKSHITWFFAGRPVGTVRSAAAVSGVPLVLRMSMVGEGTQEMNQTMVFSDWLRAYSHTTGRQNTSGAALGSTGLSTPRC